MCSVTTTPAKEMPPEFWDWYDGKRKELDLSDRQVADKAGISNSVISKARSGEQPIRYEACIKIAEAFGDPPEMVLRLAGLLPRSRGYRPSADEWSALIDGEDEATVRGWIAAIRAMKANQQKRVERRGEK